MSGYWRNVTYLGKYVDHELIEKVGFAKLEFRRGNLRGNIKITDEKSRATAWKAYIGHQEGETLFLRLLGTLVKNGNEYALTINEKSDNIGDRKLVLLGRSDEYCCDGALRNLVIQVGDPDLKTVDTAKVNTIAEKKEKISQEANLKIKSEADSEANMELNPITDPETNMELISLTDSETNMELNSIADSETNAELKVTNSETSGKVNPELNLESQPEQADDWIDKILKVSAGMYPFTDNDLSQCVRIEPKDFGLLPSKDWALGSNSFLLNGYYSYRHVLFGVKEQDGKKNCYLGVPGMYHRREIFMAKMFGFSIFKGVQDKKTATIGDFGYWMMQI